MIRMHTRAAAAAVALVSLAGLGVGVTPAQAAASATPAASYAYIAASRQGAAVYVNALIKQSSPAGIVRSAHRTTYLQRYLNGRWQPMLSRVTNSLGMFTVSFISVPNYQYRFVVAATPAAYGATSAAAQTTSPPVRYPNCAALNAVYPHGVGRSGAHDHTASGKNPVLTFIVSSAVYALNTGRDADKDGIACEKA
ncbi:MAG: excalibur calcium-binding domain-containing protein [Jatrophihabitans sp.]